MIQRNNVFVSLLLISLCQRTSTTTATLQKPLHKLQQNNVLKDPKSFDQPQQQSRLLQADPLGLLEDQAEEGIELQDEEEEEQDTEEVCLPVDECVLCAQHGQEACLQTGRRQKMECTMGRGTTAMRRSTYRPCDRTTQDEQFLMVQLQLVCLCLGVFSMVYVRKHKRDNLFEQLRHKNAMQSGGGSSAGMRRNGSSGGLYGGGEESAGLLMLKKDDDDSSQGKNMEMV